MRSLVVEDDPTSRLLLQAFLAKYGVCHVAVNGREAVRAFRAAHEEGQPYDLICMDIMMPEMDGQTALKEIRALEVEQRKAPASGVSILLSNPARIIMTSALDDVKNVMASFGSLCDAYVVKPIDTAELTSQLKKLHLI